MWFGLMNSNHIAVLHTFKITPTQRLYLVMSANLTLIQFLIVTDLLVVLLANRGALEVNRMVLVIKEDSYS